MRVAIAVVGNDRNLEVLVTDECCFFGYRKESCTSAENDIARNPRQVEKNTLGANTETEISYPRGN